jgi:lipoprotein-anchoring transpeptidase ErfK/SrfK
MFRRNFIHLFIAFVAAGCMGLAPSPANAKDTVEPANAGGKRIVVSLSQQRVYAYSGNVLVMSIGANIRGARVGNFRIQNKIPMGYSTHLGWRLPNWMGIYYGSRGVQNGFHGASINRRGGRDMTSLGCIVMRPGDATKLYRWASVGTPVTIRR